MDLDQLTRFFMWCTIINGSVFMAWTLTLVLAPDFVYRTSTRFIKVDRVTHNIAVYAFLGLFKSLLLIFVLAPFLALTILQ